MFKYVWRDLVGWGVVDLASGFFAADPAVFLGFLQIGPVDIDKKRRLAGKLSGFIGEKASNSPYFLDAGPTAPLLSLAPLLHGALDGAYTSPSLTFTPALPSAS